MPPKMVVFPNAKINIGLNILRKRTDGYHEIETLFYPIGLREALEYVENSTDRVRFESSGLSLEIDPGQNIVVKAYRMLQAERPLPGLDIHLHKVIPFGAGLGGGSADAAFFLKSLNEHFELKLSQEKLLSLAGKLGADCAFFLENRPVYATGIGEKLQPVDFSLKGWHLLLVKPPFGVDTRQAYAGVKPAAYPFDFVGVLQSGIANWNGRIRNDFETTVFALHPELARLKEQLTGRGAAYCAMSGSGSSVYALFDGQPNVSAADFPPGYFVWQEQL